MSKPYLNTESRSTNKILRKNNLELDLAHRMYIKIMIECTEMLILKLLRMQKKKKTVAQSLWLNKFKSPCVIHKSTAVTCFNM